MKTIKLFTLSIFALVVLASCSDDDTEEVLEQEFITDVVLTFTNDADLNDQVILTSIAPDGQDGTSVETTNGASFTSGATYSLSIAILNSQETPAEDVLNGDIILEADEHFFTFGVNSLNLTMSRDADDVDGSNGTKLGVNTTWVAGAASSGNLQIVLVHEPVGADDSDNFGSVTSGEEDFNITWTGLAIQ